MAKSIEAQKTELNNAFEAFMANITDISVIRERKKIQESATEAQKQIARGIGYLPEGEIRNAAIMALKGDDLDVVTALLTINSKDMNVEGYNDMRDAYFNLIDVLEAFKKMNGNFKRPRVSKIVDVKKVN